MKFIKMKNALVAIFLCFSASTFCQSKDNNISILEKIFSIKMDTENSLKQKNEGLTRELIPYIDEKLVGVKLYLLTEFDEKDQATSSVYIISKKGVENEFDLFKIKMTDEQVIFFDKIYLEQSLPDKYSVKIIAKSKGEEISINDPYARLIVLCAEGIEGICIDTWLVTRDEDTGEIISIEYLYSTCFPCNSSGTGGTPPNDNPPPPTEGCDEQTQIFALQGRAMSGPINRSGDILEGDSWLVPYNWKIFTAGTWGLISYEQGDLIKVYYGNDVPARWEYANFVHKSIGDVGMSIGGTRTFEDRGATINISGTKMRVDVRIDFSVTHTATGICPGVTIPYNANKTFYAPNKVVIR